MNLQATAQELNGKLAAIKKEISDKEAEILKLRTANAKLVELHIGKSRKPKSLGQQREQITRIDLEILELQLVQKSLNKKLMQTDAAIREEQLKSRLSQFQEASKDQLALVETVRRNIAALEKSLIQLESVSGQNGVLCNLFRLLSVHPKAKQFIDLREVLENWSVSSINLELPLEIETRLIQFNNQIIGRHRQLQAIFNGDRAVPSMPKTKSTLTQNRPLSQNQCRLQEEGLDAVKRSTQASKNKSRYADARNPNKVVFRPDRNPYVAVNQ